ncbi:16S rRNA (guanine(966)-N(2))-methyltransferase RsmD [Brachybacterium halotolerans subsp. kimchii]|uniref:16S rRNA (guanine(966)-N(2))-methyltransferase RsmD n=1 Tax=Brachybacterium halotolerans TaxID=2795215 RepID=UPI001E3FD175|nr:16S rRNA (guanine(966)-N(2))-methyltransferase RsmD [Brachybacterium halotolerans]UEJ82993.1 16S rRNA (guanine(966)-N(2))-methyltransferase RsmD [Brachybacterium halotolerans subsp. kimchii]
MPRIIAGELGGRTIPGPPGKGTRPTSDRVREALFSRLEGWDALRGARVLDLFAGTGALAFEALSRGAESALMVEMHGPTARQLGTTAGRLGLSARCTVRTGKGEQVAAQLAEAGVPADGGFSLVMLDPPYDLPTEALEQLLRVLRPALADDALVVIERSSRSRPLSWPEDWADDGTKTYGETVLQYGGPATD